MIAELATFQSLAGGLKTAGEIVKALIAMKVTADIQAKIIDLNGIILASQSDAMLAQAAQATLLKRVDDLEGELVKLERWEAEKQRYEPKSFTPGVLLHALKQEFVQAGEPPHQLCPRCYQDGNGSVMQATPETFRRYRKHICPRCKTELMYSTPNTEPPPPPEPPPQIDFGVP